jgi:alcohol dehydrogenase
MHFNRDARLSHMAHIAEMLGEDIRGLTTHQAADRAVAAVHRLKADIGIPSTLSEVSVRREHLLAMAEQAAGMQRLLRVNPRAASREDLMAILESAL